MFQEITLSPQRKESSEENNAVHDAKHDHPHANIEHPFKFSPMKNGDRSQSLNRVMEYAQSHSSKRSSPPRSKS